MFNPPYGQKYIKFHYLNENRIKRGEVGGSYKDLHISYISVAMTTLSFTNQDMAKTSRPFQYWWHENGLGKFHQRNEQIVHYARSFSNKLIIHCLLGGVVVICSIDKIFQSAGADRLMDYQHQEIKIISKANAK